MTTLKPLFSNCSNCRTKPTHRTRQKAVAARPVGDWLQCCSAHLPGNKLPEPQRSQPSRFHDVEAL